MKELKSELIKLEPSLDISDPLISRPCEPQLLIKYHGVGICLYAGQKSRNTIILVYLVIDSRDKLDALASKLGEQIKKQNYGDSAYFKEDWMKVQIPMNDINSIYRAIKKAQESIDKI